jgi:hypothetical protein
VFLLYTYQLAYWMFIGRLSLSTMSNEMTTTPRLRRYPYHDSSSHEQRMHCERTMIIVYTHRRLFRIQCEAGSVIKKKLSHFSHGSEQASNTHTLTHSHQLIHQIKTKHTRSSATVPNIIFKIWCRTCRSRLFAGHHTP